MNRTQMKAIAKRRGIVRWTISGIYERLELRQKRLVASGPVTPMHFLTGENFDCVEINPKLPVAVGEVLYPRGGVPTVLRKLSWEFQSWESEVIEKKTRKKNERILRDVMES